MPQYGPIPAEIAIIGDYPDRSGDGYSRVAALLSKLGITSTSCYFSTLTETAPPLTKGQPEIDHWISERKTCPGAGWVHHQGKWFHPTLAAGAKSVEARLAEVAPKLVITLGKAPLAWLAGPTGIAKWRGSRLTPADKPYTLLPTLHPRTLLNQPEQSFILTLDIKRAYNIYTHKQLPRLYNFTIAPTLDQVLERLTELFATAEALRTSGSSEKLKLSGDLETRAANIACFGIAWSAEDAICIPHLVINDDNPFYWSLEDEAQIVWLYAQLFHHPNILWIGQNYLYDTQYFWRHWGFLPIHVRDTMIAHHSLHSNIRKGLDFLSSMYAQDHVYWKEEIKDWNPKLGEKQFWEYNCKDACITYEIDAEIIKERERE